MPQEHISDRTWEWIVDWIVPHFMGKECGGGEQHTSGAHAPLHEASCRRDRSCAAFPIMVAPKSILKCLFRCDVFFSSRWEGCFAVLSSALMEKEVEL